MAAPVALNRLGTQEAPQASPPRAAPKTAEPPPSRRKGSRKWFVLLMVALAAAGGLVGYLYLNKPKLPPGFASGNGRLEATQIYIAAKYPGRVAEVLFNEGDTVEAGQVVARMDTTALEAQLREAQAQIRQAQDERRVAQADVSVKQAEYAYADQQYQRSKGLVPKGAVSQQEAEIDNAKMLASRAELVGSRAGVTKAGSAIDAARATADRLRAEIADSVLVAPKRVRIDSRLAEPGEVLPQGGRVFSTLDLSDVYMYVFLPESVTGKVPLGSEARIVLDAAPQAPIRAYVSYVSAQAQFTPKTVETAEERRNLTFRVKLQLDRAKLRLYEQYVKAGVPGMGYVRYDTSKAWPADLQVKQVNPAALWNPAGAAPAALPASAAPPAGSSR